MSSPAVAASATVVSAQEIVGTHSEGVASWWEDAAEQRFGSTRWALELDVAAPDGAVQRVQGTFKMPNRLHKLRKSLDGRPRLQPGVVLPVQVDPSDPGSLEIDWKTLVATGGLAQLYPPEGPGLRGTVHQVAADLRAGPEITEHPTPEVSRPTPATHPPIEGVDFDTWIAGAVGLVRDRVKRKETGAYLAARGFPAGRGDAVNQAWMTVVKADRATREWYVYEMAQLRS